MRMWTQILAGSVVLLIGAAIHIIILAGSVSWLEIASEDGSHLKILPVILLGFGAILVGHTLQVWLWALALRLNGALSNIEDAVYFALVTTTTLGYGDITLSKPHRIFGSMAAVSGLLSFGLSTAFLVGVVEAVFP